MHERFFCMTTSGQCNITIAKCNLAKSFCKQRQADVILQLQIVESKKAFLCRIGLILCCIIRFHTGFQKFYTNIKN